MCKSCDERSCRRCVKQRQPGCVLAAIDPLVPDPDKDDGIYERLADLCHHYSEPEPPEPSAFEKARDEICKRFKTCPEQWCSWGADHSCDAVIEDIIRAGWQAVLKLVREREIDGQFDVWLHNLDAKEQT